MERWASEYRAFAVECFLKHNDSATITQREFRRHFNIGRNGKVPTRQIILNWVKQFRLTGSALSKKNTGRPRSVRTPENVERVKLALQQSPHCSARRQSVELGMSDRSIRRILQIDLQNDEAQLNDESMIFKTLNSDMTPKQVIETIIKCTNFAAIKHKNQRRKDSEHTPYINHPIGVAYILIEEAQIYDIEVIQSALLHDTVEDTDTSFDEIESAFGENVRKIVEEVTDDKTLPKDERKKLQIVHAPNASYKAKLVKLADKLYNLRDLQRETPDGWTANRVEEYFEWSKKVVDGLRGTNEDMEDKLDDMFRAKKLM